MSRRGRWLIAPALALAFGVPGARAADPGGPGDVRRLFQRTAPIELPEDRKGRLFRLELGANVLAECRGDLSDLRIVDARGVELPFVVDRGAERDAELTRHKVVAAKILTAERQKIPRQGADPLRSEIYELEAPPEPPAGSVWELWVEAGAPSFVRRLDVETSARGKARHVVDKGSVFRLKDGHGERLSARLEPPLGARLRVTFSGEESFALEPRFRFEAVERLTAEPVALVPLPVLDVTHARSETELVLARPLGIVPDALRFQTATEAFSRRVLVRASGPGTRSEQLGASAVFRVPGAVPVEELDVRLEPAQSQRIAVTIQNGDSPPLEALRALAVIRTPSLVFALPAGAEPPSVALYFGGGRAHAPKYDLAALLPAVTDAGVRRAETALRLAAIVDNPAFDRAPALAFAQRAGARVDARLYSHRRAVELTPSADGLAEVPLSFRDLSVMRADLADVRLVDAELRQWPYWLEPEARRQSVELAIGARRREGRETRTRLGLPFAPLAARELVFGSHEPYFDRAYRVFGKTPGGDLQELASGRIARRPDAPAPELVVALGGMPLEALEIGIDDGENAALELTGVRAGGPVPALYVVAPAGKYQLLLGNPEDQRPAYDIEPARHLLASVKSRESRPGPLEANAAYSAKARLGGKAGAERALLWVVLGLAVAILGVLTLRLARAKDPPA